VIPEVVAVESTEACRLPLTFDDGTKGEVDLETFLSFVGVFEPLRDPAEFRKVRVDPESGTIAWPNGAGIDPLVLYSKVKGIDVEYLLGA